MIRKKISFFYSLFNFFISRYFFFYNLQFLSFRRQKLAIHSSRSTDIPPFVYPCTLFVISGLNLAGEPRTTVWGATNLAVGRVEAPATVAAAFQPRRTTGTADSVQQTTCQTARVAGRPREGSAVEVASEG